MSFDSWGRRFACSNSDHLQLFVYDDTLVPPGSAFALPAPRTSIAADGGAAEVFRISPDEPWRIVRTRWRVGGVVAGLVEGSGRRLGVLHRRHGHDRVPRGRVWTGISLFNLHR